MNILLWIIFGGLAGWIATILLGSDASHGVLFNVIVGIIGAFLGGWIADKLGAGGAPGAERPTGVWSFIVAVLGAILLLLILSWI